MKVIEGNILNLLPTHGAHFIIPYVPAYKIRRSGVGFNQFGTSEVCHELSKACPGMASDMACQIEAAYSRTSSVSVLCYNGELFPDGRRKVVLIPLIKFEYMHSAGPTGGWPEIDEIEESYYRLPMRTRMHAWETAAYELWYTFRQHRNGNGSCRDSDKIDLPEQAFVWVDFDTPDFPLERIVEILQGKLGSYADLVTVVHAPRKQDDETSGSSPSTPE